MTTVEDLLNIVYDEQWVRLCFHNDEDKHIDVWGADWIGGYQPVLDELEPYLDCEVDDMFVANCKSPEPYDGNKRVNMICVTVYTDYRKKKSNAD